MKFLDDYHNNFGMTYYNGFMHIILVFELHNNRILSTVWFYLFKAIEIDNI